MLAKSRTFGKSATCQMDILSCCCFLIFSSFLATCQMDINFCSCCFLIFRSFLKKFLKYLIILKCWKYWVKHVNQLFRYHKPNPIVVERAGAYPGSSAQPPTQSQPSANGLHSSIGEDRMALAVRLAKRDLKKQRENPQQSRTQSPKAPRNKISKGNYRLHVLFVVLIVAVKLYSLASLFDV